MLFGIHVQDYRVDCLPVVTTNKKINTDCNSNMQHWSVMRDARGETTGYQRVTIDNVIWQHGRNKTVEDKSKGKRRMRRITRQFWQLWYKAHAKERCAKWKMAYLCIHPGQTNKNDRPSFAPTTWNHCNSLIIHWTVWLIDIRDNFIIVQYCIGYINNYIDDKQYFNPKIVDGSPSFFIGLQILSVPRLAAIRYLLRCVEFVHTSRHCHE